jgi:hypothetical protein
MANHKVVTTDAEIDAAIEQAKHMPDEPRAVHVEYVSGSGLELVILKMSDGRRHVIPREDLQGLATATPKQISRVEILGNGTGLHWPELDVDHYVPALLRHVYGNKQWMAKIGRRGGSATTKAKRQASRANGAKGGRPRRQERLTPA